jgi:hypothetical protein
VNIVNNRKKIFVDSPLRTITLANSSVNGLWRVENREFSNIMPMADSHPIGCGLVFSLWVLRGTSTRKGQVRALWSDKRRFKMVSLLFTVVDKFLQSFFGIPRQCPTLPLTLKKNIAELTF